eukprot:NODE_21_length_38511_cov_0.503306.p5 type:complete len:825 gc:universal NODE_21_length_38511_cov_0.503306:34632-37106(+)
MDTEAANSASFFEQHLSNLPNNYLYTIDQEYSFTIPVETVEHVISPDFKLDVSVNTGVSVFLHYTGSEHLGVPIVYHLTLSDKSSGFQNHRFSTHPEEQSSGYNNFVLFVPNTVLEFHLCVINDPTMVLFHHLNNYNSRLVTGCIGLNNQGATCYLNSLLQSLYITNIFHFHVNTIDTLNHNPNNSVALALQRLFYKMQISNTAANTNELTSSFGWHSFEAFQQHDIQELLRVLQDHLEEELIKLNKSNFIRSIFGGTLRSYIKCINIDYTSDQFNPFYDLQLQVKNNSNLDNAFKHYLIQETLDGDNQYSYNNEKHDAIKGLSLYEFPLVLHLQLCRFEYDFNNDCMVKLNDYFEYPPVLNVFEYLDANSPQRIQCLNQFNASSTSESPQDEPQLLYDLYTVMVHAGDVNHGHYYAYIKVDDVWYKCDDELVTIAQHNHVFTDNYGQANSNNNNTMYSTRYSTRFKSSTNAYMLVYFKRDAINDIINSVDNTPLHVINQITTEINEYNEQVKRKLYFDSHITIKIYSLENMDSIGTFIINHPWLPDSVHEQLEVENITHNELLLKLDSNYYYYILVQHNTFPHHYKPMFLINDSNSLNTLIQHFDSGRCMHIMKIAKCEITTNTRFIFIKLYNSTTKTMSNVMAEYVDGLQTINDLLKTAIYALPGLQGPLIAVDELYKELDVNALIMDYYENDGNIIYVTNDAQQLQAYLDDYYNRIKVNIHVDRGSDATLDANASGPSPELIVNRFISYTDLMDLIKQKFDINDFKIYNRQVEINSTNVNYQLNQQIVDITCRLNENKLRKIVELGKMVLATNIEGSENYR